MKKVVLVAFLFLFLFLFLPFTASAKLLPVLNYKTVQCELLLKDKAIEAQRSKLMTIMDEDRLLRFTQLTWGSTEQTLQYQLLIEDDLKNPGSLIFLQNFQVGNLESSSEFSTSDARWLRIRQGDYAVVCEINP